jgi:SAM-dependent methyltransferase
MTDDELRQKWDQRYQQTGAAPCALEVLVENSHLLPPEGSALDLACGMGGSGLLLAEHGLNTWAWDLSPVAIDALEKRAANLPLIAEVRDVVRLPPPPGGYDVICVGHFLDREICPEIAAALRPGGLLFYQTFTRERVDQTGPGTQGYRLGPNELLELFPGLLVRFYREEGRLGDPARGFRNRAQLVAQQPQTTNGSGSE